jgi:hypothetical protein
MLAAFTPFLADAAEEGRNIILGMLVTGLIFIAVILIGDLGHLALERRRRRRRRPTY